MAWCMVAKNTYRTRSNRASNNNHVVVVVVCYHHRRWLRNHIFHFFFSKKVKYFEKLWIFFIFIVDFESITNVCCTQFLKLKCKFAICTIDFDPPVVKYVVELNWSIRFEPRLTRGHSRKEPSNSGLMSSSLAFRRELFFSTIFPSILFTQLQVNCLPEIARRLQSDCEWKLKAQQSRNKFFLRQLVRGCAGWTTKQARE